MAVKSQEGISQQAEILLDEIERREQNARPEFGDISDEIQRLAVTAHGLGISHKTIIEVKIKGITANPFLPESQKQGILELLGEHLKEEQTKEQQLGAERYKALG